MTNTNLATYVVEHRKEVVDIALQVLQQVKDGLQIYGEGNKKRFNAAFNHKIFENFAVAFKSKVLCGDVSTSYTCFDDVYISLRNINQSDIVIYASFKGSDKIGVSLNKQAMVYFENYTPTDEIVKSFSGSCFEGYRNGRETCLFGLCVALGKLLINKDKVANIITEYANKISQQVIATDNYERKLAEQKAKDYAELDALLGLAQTPPPPQKDKITISGDKTEIDYLRNVISGIKTETLEIN